MTKKKQVWPNYNIEKHLLRPGLSFFSFEARRYFVENLPSLKTLSSLPFFDLFRALTKGKSSRDTPRLFLLFYFPTRKASGEQIKTGPPCSTHKKCHFFCVNFAFDSLCRPRHLSIRLFFWFVYFSVLFFCANFQSSAMANKCKAPQESTNFLPPRRRRRRLGIDRARGRGEGRGRGRVGGGEEATPGVGDAQTRSARRADPAPQSDCASLPFY